MEGLEILWMLVQLFLVITIFGFVRNYTGNTTLALIIGGLLVYLFVFRYPFLGVGYLALANIFLLIFAAWVIFAFIPK